MSPTFPAARARAAAALLAGALLAFVIPVTAAAAAAPPLPVGAPLSAKVHLQSLMGVPPDGYSLICTSQPGCTTSGNVDLETEATVPVEFDPRTRTVHGAAALPYSTAEGTVEMGWSCGDEPGRYRSVVSVDDTQAGELAVTDIAAPAGTNSLSVTLDPGGEGGFAFPRETVDRSDGGCGTPVQDLTQKMGTWYYHFYLAHKTSTGLGDVRLDGLKWRDGVYTRTLDHFVNVGTPPYVYPLYERTTVEVTPDYCTSKQNQIASATSDGESLGVDGMRFYAGQQLTFPAKTRVRLADGSVMDFDEGGSVVVSDCSSNETELTLTHSIGSLWVHLKHLVNGPSKKFDVVTKRAVAGARGTIFEVSYDKAKEETKVAVTEHEVSLKGRNGAKGKVMIGEGEVGVQKGKHAPRIIKR